MKHSGRNLAMLKHASMHAAPPGLAVLGVVRAGAGEVPAVERDDELILSEHPVVVHDEELILVPSTGSWHCPAEGCN